MYYLRDIEEQIELYQRMAAQPRHLEDRDLDVLEDLQREQRGEFKRRLAAALVDLGVKVHAGAAIRRASSYRAA